MKEVPPVTNTTSYTDPFSFDNPSVQRIIAKYTQLNRKCTAQDCEQSHLLVSVAEWYALWYSGKFEFMVSMANNYQRWGKLTIGQASGTINCMLADYKYYQARQAEIDKQYAAAGNKNKPQLITDADLPQDLKPVSAPEPIQVVDAKQVTPVVLDGTFSIVLDETGKYRTLKISTISTEFLGNKPEGTQIVKYLSGADNTSDYTACAYLFGSQVVFFKNFKSQPELARALDILCKSDKEAQIDLGHAYALESGVCWRCGRKLTVPASINRGMGPICADKI